MRSVKILAAVIVLISSCIVYGQPEKRPVAQPVKPPAQPRTLATPAPPPMTVLQMFDYQGALDSFARTETLGKPGYDKVDCYGANFDNDNYKRAMADEFERNRYRVRIRAKIDEEVRKVNFNQKFTMLDYRKLGEYSFERHAFDFDGVSSITNRVNWNQFAWWLHV